MHTFVVFVWMADLIFLFFTEEVTTAYIRWLGR